jgi:uncharacterized protein with PIN domain
MRFLVDAQLPRRIAHRLREQGHDAIHTLDLPEANRTADNTIADVADREDRVVVKNWSRSFFRTFPQSWARSRSPISWSWAAAR